MVTALSPTNNATGLCVDTLLRITFDKTVLLQKSGAIRIYDTLAPAIPVDTIDLGANVDNAPSHQRPASHDRRRDLHQPSRHCLRQHRDHFPASGVLTTNKTYYVLMDTGVFTDTLGNVFPGISATNSGGSRPRPPARPTARTSSLLLMERGDFCTVQGAVDYIPSGNTTPRLINIRDGTYTEIVNVNNRHNLTFRGQSRSNTVIAYDNNSAMNGSTHYRMAFKVNANDIALDTLTITNSTPRGGSQAEALMVETDKKRFVAWNVNLCSYQDTILIEHERHAMLFPGLPDPGRYRLHLGRRQCLLHQL